LLVRAKAEAQASGLTNSATMVAPLSPESNPAASPVRTTAMAECGQASRGMRLTALDRCDRCSARATVATMSSRGSLLMWCAHHYQDHADALSAAGAVIVTDDRSRT